MANAQLFWIAIISETDVRGNENVITSGAGKRIFADLLTSSQQLIENCNAYSEEDLLKQIPSTDMIQSRYEFILHVVNHNTYHRGQIVTMSHCLGVSSEIPALDYEAFLWSDGQIIEA
jgi:uncharacterized damage-inducible protein DinB